MSGRNRPFGEGSFEPKSSEDVLRPGLDSWEAPKARPAFRAELRRKFLDVAARDAGQENSEHAGEAEASPFGAGVWDALPEKAPDAAPANENSPRNGKGEVTDPAPIPNTTHVSNTAKSFQSLLDTWTPEAPSAAFRDQMRERFLSAASASSATAEGASARSAGSDHVEVPEQSTPTRSAAHPRQRQSQSQSSPSVTRRAPASARSQRRRTWSLVGGSVALAAAAVLVMALLPRGGTEVAPASGWSLLSGGQVALVDGQALDLADSSALSGGGFALADAPQQVTAGDETLRLRFGDQMVLELEPGSTLDVSDLTEAGHADGEWVLSMQGETGGYRVATMEGFRRDERRLLFRTPDAEVEVVGTVFGVDRYPDRVGGKSGTCVCCCDGEVQVRSLVGAGSDAVKTGQSNYVYTASGEMKAMPHMPEGHGKPLELLAKAFHTP